MSTHPQRTRALVSRELGDAPNANTSPVVSSTHMRYAIVIEKAEGNYSAYVPDLPGCVATGATPEETERAIREAIEFHLEGLREDGSSSLDCGG